MACAALLVACVPSLALAAVEIIEATGRYHLGDNDTKLQARALALQEAKRNALERAGTFLESVSEVSRFAITKDRVRTYAAGILEVVETSEDWKPTGESMTVTVSVKVAVDPEDVARQIAVLRTNDEASESLRDSAEKITKYERQIAELNRQIREMKGPSAVTVTKAREKALTGVRVAELLAKAAVAMTGSEDRRSPSLIGTVSNEALARAEKLWTQALELDPDSAVALSGLGSVSVHRGEYAKAKELYSRALRLAPEDAVTHAALGSALFGQGEVQAAIQSEREAIRLDPQLAAAYDNLGFFLFKSGDLQGAGGAYRQAIALKPDYPVSHKMLGVVLMKQGDVDGAITQLEVAIRIAPDNATAYNDLGYALARRGDRRASQRAFDEACLRGSSNACDRAQELRR